MNKSLIFEEIFQQSINAQLLIDSLSKRIIRVNKVAEKIFGYIEKDLIGERFTNFIASESDDTFKRNVFTLQNFITVNGEELSLEMFLIDISKYENDVILVTIQDVNDRIETERKLRNTLKKMRLLSTIDGLTNINNRRSMMKKINYELVRLERNKEPFALVLCDVDNFKATNDAHGHDAGDFILQEIAKLMFNAVRKQDTVGRWGGDEFLLLLPQTTLSGGFKLAENIRNLIMKQTFEFKDIILHITLTFGISAYEESETIDECLKRSDLALYEGKRMGRNVSIKAK